MKLIKKINKKNIPPVFILSHDPRKNPTDREINIIALTIARNVGRAGVPVIMFHPNKLDFALCSKYIKHIQCPNVDKKDALMGFLADIAKLFDCKGVMFPA